MDLPAWNSLWRRHLRDRSIRPEPAVIARPGDHSRAQTAQPAIVECFQIVERVCRLQKLGDDQRPNSLAAESPAGPAFDASADVLESIDPMHAHVRLRRGRI